MADSKNSLFGDDKPLFSDNDKLFSDDDNNHPLFSDEKNNIKEADNANKNEINIYRSASARKIESSNTWKVLIVDDEEDIHQVTKLALRTFSYRDKKIEFFDAYSAKEAAEMLKENNDFAIILLDVVMENNHAGLELVKQIREKFGNYFSRIILRTGQPGQAPEKEVINKYEINDYKTKTELTQDKLYTVIMSGLRAFESLLTIDSYRQNLEEKVKERTKELAKANEELKKLSLVASKTDNAVAILDKDGNFEWINEGFSRLYELNYKEFTENIGTSIFDTVRKSYRNEFNEIIPDSPEVENILSKIHSAIDEIKTISFEFATLTKSGKKIIVNTTITPITNEEGKISKLIAIDSDITKIKEAEMEIKKQKEEITDSIKYARRIQSAILPNEEYVTKSLPNHFILFKPRDIVSGDFYWAAQIENELVVVAADCTGHGVPGAFMSILGISILNDLVNKQKIIHPHEILNQLRYNVIKALNPSEKVSGNGTYSDDNIIKDGMDISICVLNLDTNRLMYAGAHNPLYLIRNTNEEPKIDIYKADKMPIGVYVNIDQSFTNHVIDLKKGDTFYIFSDGYADQFGGASGKKFKYNQFRQLLLDIQNKDMKGQKNMLELEIEKWMGKHQQLDDIVIIGMKI